MVGFTGILVCWLEFILAIATPFRYFLCSQARLLGWKLDVGFLDLLTASASFGSDSVGLSK